MIKYNFLVEQLPNIVAVDGRTYEIHSDFRVGLQVEELFRNQELSDGEKILKMLLLYYPVIPENINEAVEKMLWFYRCGEEEEKEEKKKRYERRTSKEPAFSFSQDAPYIYAAFKEQYSIDLAEISDMHWWKFMALFESLNEDTKMSKIMYYRKASVSGMSRERRAFINEMKKLYRINGDVAGKKMTLTDRNQKWLNYVKDRCGKAV